jgi:hypothetical protein
MSVFVQPPFPIFTGIDGQPLENGYIWIGAANLDPEGNPIAVYWDSALTIPAPQPIRTVSGYPARAGSPARLYVGQDYSIRVRDKNGTLVYASLNDNAFSGGTIAVNATGNGVQVSFPVSSVPVTIYINGVYQNKNTYTVSGGAVIFSEAPPVTSVIEFVF